VVDKMSTEEPPYL